MANKKYKLTDGNMWATDGIHDFGQNKTQRTINSEVNTALGGKAPTNHASTSTTYGKGTSSNYGHVKISDSLTDTTPAATGGVVPSMKAVSDLNGAIKQQLPTGGWICGVYGFITNGAKDIRLTVPIASYSATTVRVTDKISSIVAALRIPSGGYVAGLDTDITNYLVYADLASGGRGLSMRFTKDSAWTNENGVALPNNIPICGLITITTNDDI